MNQQNVSKGQSREQALDRPTTEIRNNQVTGSSDLGQLSENRSGTRHVPNVPRQEAQSDPGQDQTVPEYLSNQPLDDVEGWSLVQKRSRRRKV